MIKTPAPSKRPLRTIKGAAERLSVSSRTVRRLIDRGDLTAIWIGRSIRIDDDDLDTLIWRQRKRVT